MLMRACTKGHPRWQVVYEQMFPIRVVDSDGVALLFLAIGKVKTYSSQTRQLLLREKIGIVNSNDTAGKKHDVGLARIA